MTSKVAAPFVKWAGGKRYLVPEILKRLPEKIKTYYEPFVGGGAVFFALAQEHRFFSAKVNDSNSELMQTYIALAGDPDGVIRELKKHVYDEDHYYKVRGLDPNKLSPSKLAARLIYLNRTCFNGLYRVNKKKGTFNVPFGRYVNPTICDEPNLRAVSDALEDVIFSSKSFEKAVADARPGRDAVYFDPPYAPTDTAETASFTAYSKDGFGLKDHERLRDTAAALIERGVHVLLSNSDTRLVRRLYKDKTVFKLEEVTAPRRVNSKASARGNVGELLISGRR